MDESLHERGSQLFLRAVKRPAEERVTFVDSEADGDPELRDYVLQLLEHDAESFHVLDESIGVALPAEDSVYLPPTIGPFRVLRRIGLGGMGVVYEAEQSNPRRRVAVKVIRAGMAADETVRRFEREVEILGKLEHAGIARIYDAGEIRDEHAPQPYLAMEFIEGRPLDEHLQESEAAIDERLRLFTQICDAVEYAHQSGVIHRDLKPANILVTDAGESKILDFGVATISDVDQRATMQTRPGQIVGTVAYMSPEQAGGDRASIDSRTDVYSLGVLLCQMVTGQLPHDLSGLGLPTALSVIRTAAPRVVPVDGSRLDPDLAVLVGCALEKDPDRRFQSAAQLAADVRRYLRQEPILARPPSAVYQLRKFVGRHRALTGAALLAFVALLVGTIVSLNYAGEAAVAEGRARDEAEQARIERNLARSEAAASRRFVTAITRMFKRIDPMTALGKEPTLAEAMTAAAGTIDTELAQDPLIRARLHTFFGAQLAAIGRHKYSIVHHRKSIEIYREHEIVHRDVCVALSAHAWYLYKVGRLDDSEELCEEGLDIARKVGLEVGEMSANFLCTLGEIAMRRRDFDTAVDYVTRSLEMRRQVFEGDHDDTAVSLLVLGDIDVERHRYDDAEKHLEASLAMRRRLHGKTHPLIAEGIGALSRIAFHRGRYDEAAKMTAEVVAIKRRIWPKGHPSLASTLGNLAILAARNERFDEAAKLQREAIGMFRAAFGADSQEEARVLMDLARTYLHQEDRQACQKALQRAIAIYDKIYDKPFYLRAVARVDLGICLLDRDQPAESKRVLLLALEEARAVEKPPGRSTREALAALIRLSESVGNEEDAERYRKQHREISGESDGG